MSIVSKFFKKASDLIKKPFKKFGEKLVQKKIEKALPEVKLPQHQSPSAKPLIDKVNDTMAYIQSEPTLNRDDTLSMNLKIAMDKLIGDRGHDYKPGEENQYFKVLDTWDGKDSSLISNVIFKDIGTDPTVAEYLETVTDSKWGSEERHEEYLKKAQRAAYEKNIENLDLGLSDNMINTLENLMNSSEMWHIVGNQYGLGTKAYDSNQAKGAWDSMFKSVSSLINTAGTRIKSSDLNSLIQMISNEEAEDKIRDYLENTIRGYVRR